MRCQRAEDDIKLAAAHCDIRRGKACRWEWRYANETVWCLMNGLAVRATWQRFTTVDAAAHGRQAPDLVEKWETSTSVRASVLILAVHCRDPRR